MINIDDLRRYEDELCINEQVCFHLHIKNIIMIRKKRQKERNILTHANTIASFIDFSFWQSWTILNLCAILYIGISFEWFYQISSFFHHLKANILRFARIGNFLPILLSFVEEKLTNKGFVFWLTWYFSCKISHGIMRNIWAISWDQNLNKFEKNLKNQTRLLLILIYPTPWILFLLERWDIHLLTSIS